MKLFPAVLLLLLALPAAAKSYPDTGVSAEEVASLMRAKGYRAEVGEDGEGDPMVTSGVAGAKFQIYFYDCEGGRCGSLQFSAGFDLENGASPKLVNDWNARWRFVYAYLDDEQDPYVAMDVEMRGGSTDAQLGRWLDRWEELAGRFAGDLRSQPKVPDVEKVETRV